MKRFYIFFYAILAFALAGCDMNKQPYSTISPENALTTMEDAAKLRNFIYADFRGKMSGEWVYSADVQCDFFNAGVDFGNNGGDLYRWDFSANLGNALTVWQGSYNSIQNDNYRLKALNDYIAVRRQGETSEGRLTEADSTTICLYKGESFFSRAYFYYQLATFFCEDYDASTAGSAYGVPVVLEYNPTSDDSQYPGRTTLAQTFEQINSDLDSAEYFINVEGAVGSNYITKDVVSAMRARVYLYMDMYEDAIRYAEPLIEKYPLVDSDSTYRKMWLNDTGEETIMQIFGSISELPSSSSYGYVSYNDAQAKYTPMYVPTQTVIDLYEPNDIRLKEGFLNVTVNLSTGNFSGIYLLNKFPGNPTFYQGTQNNYVNSPKPFRIAEQYLILAEAYALSGNDGAGSEILNRLQANRNPNHAEVSYTGQQLIQEIRDERVRELIGEGFRLSDLRRYNNGMVRGEAQNTEAIYMPGDSRTDAMEKAAGDNRFVWPIPTEELTTNPQLRQQQNEGY